MDAPATEEQVRTLAYHLWEEAGSPEGRADEFWAQALKQLGVQDERSDGSRTTDQGHEPDTPPASND